jgi:hypothetical protein
MKKLFLFFGALLLLILIALVSIPIIFKEDIQSAVDEQLDNALSAQVYYNTGDFRISLIKSFPNLSVSIGNFGIVGEAVFAKDTLASIENFSLTLDVMSVINGDQIKIIDVSLTKPKIKVKVLADGTANYDIAATSEEATGEENATESAPLSIQISNWQIIDGSVIYDDATLPMKVAISTLNHQGSGDFAADIFDMATKTTAGSFTMDYDGVKYINDKSLDIDLVMAMDFENMTFTFKENRAALSGFGFNFTGFVAMPSDDIVVDISYAGQDISMLSILSLIPGAYQEYLQGVTAKGSVSFDGYVKGTYNEQSMPAVSANLNVDNGSILYADYPVPMEQIVIRSNFFYPSADMTKTSFTMEKFHMSLDGEEVTASLFFKDLEDYLWDFKMDGNVDLGKITKIFPLEGMTLAGKMNAQLQTKGRMSDLEAERYQKLTTTGRLQIEKFKYLSPDLPQGFGISEAKMSFDPSDIKLEKFAGNAGKTDLNMDGIVSNYMAYALSDSATLRGKLNYSSKLVDANEWIVAEDTLMVTPEDTVALEIVRIPANIDFVLTSKIESLLYDNLDMRAFAGQVVVREGSINMNKVNFEMLKGYFEMNGEYASKPENPEYNFDFVIRDLNIAASYKAFNTIQKMAPMAEKMEGNFSAKMSLNGQLDAEMMPIDDKMQGYANVLIQDGALENLEILEKIAQVTKLKKGEDGKLTMKDVDMDLEIIDGKVFVKPFDVVLGGRKTTISGSTAVSGYMDYQMMTNVPTGKVGDAANSLLSSYLGGSSLISNSLDVTLGITGTYDDYNVKLVSAKSGGSKDGGAKSALKDAAQEKLDAAKKSVADELAKRKAEAEKLAAEKKAEVEKIAKEKAEELKQKAKEAAEKAAKDAIGDKAKDAVKDLFGKKKKSGGGE